MDIDQNIENFYRYFSGQLTEARKMARPVHGKLISMAIIDALAKIRFPMMKNRERFVEIIDIHGGWEYSNRISLQQLELALKARNLQTGRLYEIVHNEVLTWQEGGEVTPQCEHTIVQLKAHVATVEEGNLLSKCRYPELIYKFRNSLVHEYRTLGSSVEWGESPAYVFYHSQSTELENGDWFPEPWQLVIPPAFIFLLCHRILEGVRDYLRLEKTDPAVLLAPKNSWL